MNIYRRRDLFYRKPQTNLYRLFTLMVMILGGVWLVRQLQSGEIQPLFQPTPTPTRAVESYALEGDAQFIAGDLQSAITAYGEAARADPNDARIWGELARIQTYSSALLTTDPERLKRLTEGLESARQAVAIAPDDSTAHAILAFVLDWNANPTLVGDKQAVAYLTEAEQEAIRALQLDNQNTIALIFYAEILVDQQKWTQAEANIDQALLREGADQLMDLHRVYAYVLESLGLYDQAIAEYDKAIAISPNLTFLYLRAGANYRRLAFGANSPEAAKPLYDLSLEYFDKAATINEQLQIRDPIPYLSISKTYSQTGDYFAAAINVQKAIDFDPSNADTYGQLGVVFFKSRNYEGSIPALKCSVRGCTAPESCDARGGCEEGDSGTAVIGLALSPNTVVYYYVYGSVLAALSRPKQNYCAEAVAVLDEVWEFYQANEEARRADTSIPGIVQAGRTICASVGVESTPVQGTPAPPSAPETGTPTASG